DAHSSDSSSAGGQPPPPPPPDSSPTPAESTGAESTGAVPPPPPPPGPTAHQPASAGRPRWNPKRILIIGLAAVFVIVLAGAGLAWKILGGGGPQPQDVMPASVTAFARVDADPSASQKIDLL